MSTSIYTDRYTKRLRMTLSLAERSAYEKGRAQVLPEDLLEGLLNTSDINSGVAITAIEQIGNNINQLKVALGYSSVTINDLDSFRTEGRAIPFSAEAKEIADTLARGESRKLDHNYVGTEHLMLALLNAKNFGEDRVCLLKGRRITYENFLDSVKDLIS